MTQTTPDDKFWNKEVDRTQALLLIAAKFIRMHAPYRKMRCDDTMCDGECLASALEAQADEI